MCNQRDRVSDEGWMGRNLLAALRRLPEAKEREQVCPVLARPVCSEHGEQHGVAGAQSTWLGDGK